MVRCWWVVVFLLTLASSGAAQLQPPFHRAWKTKVDHQLGSATVIGDRLFYGTSNAFGAVDLASGKHLWKRSLAEKSFGAEVAWVNGTLYVAVGQEGLLACDPKTGTTRWNIPGSYYGIQPQVVGTRVLATRKEGFLSAIDTRTHRVLWTADLRRLLLQKKTNFFEDMHGPSVLAILRNNAVVVGTHDAEVFCLELASGKVRWRYSFPRPNYRGEVIGIQADRGRVLVGQESRLVALDATTGKRRWQQTVAPVSVRFGPVIANGLAFVLTHFGELIGWDAVTGKQRWVRRLTLESSRTVSPLVVHRGQLLVGGGNTLYAFQPNGTLRWKYELPDDVSEQALIPTAQGFVFVGFHDLQKFARGAPPALPTDRARRQALARELVSRVDGLDRAEKRRLEALGDDAFAVVFPLVQRRLEEYLALKAQKTRSGSSARDAERALRSATEYLALVMQPQYTDQLLALIAKMDAGQGDEHARSLLFQALVGESNRRDYTLPHRADPKRVVPLFLDEVRRRPTRGGVATALSYLLRSSHPAVLAFLKEQLAKSDADPGLRRAAFLSLARTGGAAFVPAVLAAKDTTRQKTGAQTQWLVLGALPPRVLSEKERRFAGTWVAATKTAADNPLWALVVSGALGSYRDLWIARWDGTRWAETYFTGAQQIVREQEATIPADWLERFVNNPALRMDQDGDGLTDLLEARLGTNPKDTDTDHDGIPDGQDRNPLAAPRPLTETEQVLAAAFEARFHFEEEGSGLCLVELPPGVRPLELFGWQGSVIVEADKATSPLDKQVGHGVASISFGPPAYDFNGAALRPSKTGKWLLWNQDHTEAKLLIETFYGSLNATGYDIRVKKFGAHWVVVEADMIWIS